MEEKANRISRNFPASSHILNDLCYGQQSTYLYDVFSPSFNSRSENEAISLMPLLEEKVFITFSMNKILTK